MLRIDSRWKPNFCCRSRQISTSNKLTVEVTTSQPNDDTQSINSNDDGDKRTLDLLHGERDLLIVAPCGVRRLGGCTKVRGWLRSSVGGGRRECGLGVLLPEGVGGLEVWSTRRALYRPSSTVNIIVQPSARKTKSKHPSVRS